ncbi:MAG TPA: FAD-dependent oxidoreductase [Myxococcota bacterium]|nr:FAD-dependent oxidoreductase [Myxococcota bacterium]
MSERVAVAGAGIAGLSCALALGGRGFELTLYERDPPPPAQREHASETALRRRGVPQAVHPHFFMGRLREAFRARHPELLERLVAAGAGEGRFEDSLHPLARSHYVPRRLDASLTSIAARRTTFETVMRDYVCERGLARIEHGASAVGLSVEPGAAGAPARVRGLRVERGGAREEISADVVIDASGRAGELARELRAHGVRLYEERHDSGILYFTRHYELQRGRAFPSAHGLPGLLFADFVVGALPADAGAFTVTYQVQRDDPELIAIVREPEAFQALAMQLPVIARWVAPEQARPTSEVFGFGQMDSFWRSTLARGEPQVLGLYFAGDTAARTNPRYGRGCTWSFVAAERLAETLLATRDPRERALRYERALERALRADWRTMLAMDRASRRRFEVAAGRRPARLPDRAREALSTLLDEAQLADADFFRGIWAGYHGLTGMSAWLRDPRAWLGLARGALRRRRERGALGERAQRPSRAQILRTFPARAANESRCTSERTG